MSEYDSAIALAARLTTKKGKDITITKVESTLDPVTGNQSEPVTTNQTVKAVVLPASGGKIQALDIRYNLSSQTFERLSYFIVAGSLLTFTPKPGHKATIESETWTVLGATPLNPNSGTAIIYEVALRI